MGQKKKLIKAVIDTNVFISAVLFQGWVSPLVDLWKEGKFDFLISKEILEEYIRVFCYQKFKLTNQELHIILNEVLLPFVTIINPAKKEKLEIPRDVNDLPFIVCAAAGKADYLITGDRDLLEYHGRHQRARIIPVREFMEKLDE